MTDTMTKERRSWTMSRIHSKDTKPELVVRKYLFSRGLRFRVNVGRLPGHPDIVLAKHNALIEVRGCFWHRHEGCATATSPKSHVRFWREKFKRNVARDKLHEEQWAAAGWRVFIVWECELRPFVREVTLAKLYAAIVGNPTVAYAEDETPAAVPLAAETTADYKA
jgi:DNA mismatch endonuclease (patch repair protein)